jgi:UDP-glucose 4-epimerase
MTFCLVTGGAGFLGSHLVGALLGRGYGVRVLDNFSTGTRANLSPWTGQVEVVEGDLADFDLLCRATRGVDLVFHQAAPLLAVEGARVGGGPGDPGTLHVLIAARMASVRRVIYASSLCVYGPAAPWPHAEGDPANPVSPYAAAKLAGEQDCIAFTHLYGLETVRLRFVNVFGPRQAPASPYAAVVLQALGAMSRGQAPVLAGDGYRPQDLLYIDDAVHAALLAAEARRVSGRVYNVTRGRPTTPLEVVAVLNRLLGTSLRPRHVAPVPRGELDNLTEGTRAEAELGFCAHGSLERELAKCLSGSGEVVRRR